MASEFLHSQTDVFHRGVSGEGIHLAVKRAAIAGLQDENGEEIDKLVLAALRAAYRHLYGVEFREETNDAANDVAGDGRAALSWTTRPPARV
jgi:hypothetical protein